MVACDSMVSKKRLRKAEGYQIFDRRNKKVLPLEYVGDSSFYGEVTEFAAKALNKHEKTLKGNQISIRQRQTIKVVPIAECHYRYKNGPVRTFYLFGKDHDEVHAPSFPSNVKCSLM